MTDRRADAVEPRPRVTVVGLGPAGPELWTQATRAAIFEHEHRYLRTSRHPSADVVGEAISLDRHYEEAQHFGQVYARVVDEVVAGAIRSGRVLYAVPGSPLVAEHTVELLLTDDRVDVDLLPALSFLDLAWVRLGVDPLAAGVRVVDAHRFSVDAAGERGPLLVAQADTAAVLADVVAAVHDPPKEPVVVLQRLGTDDESVAEVAWDEMPSLVRPDHLTSLWVPRLAAPVASELQGLVDLVALLRLSCPWDAEQTHASLRPHLLEEAHEVLEALDCFDAQTGRGSEALEEELGDLLFQVVFHARIAADDGRFDLADVARGIHDKLRHRHPHVFPSEQGRKAGAGLGSVDSATDVLANWDIIKKAEKGRESVLDGIPATLPALALAQKVVRRASSLDGAPELPAPKVAVPAQEREFGELLLGLAAVAKKAGIDAEEALRTAVARYSAEVRAHENTQGNARGSV